MNDKKKDRYDIDNLPIRDEDRELLKTEKLADVPAITVIYTVGRMLCIWELATDEQFDNLFKAIGDLSKNVKSSQESFRKRIRSLEEKVKILEEKVA